MIFDNYPYTNFHEMNDDWIIKTLREFDKKLDEFVTMNSLTYADPIEYNPESSYPANTVVIYNDTAYVSKQTIPAGMLPTTGGEYWLEIFPFGALIEQSITDMESQIDEYIAAANAQLAAAISTLPTYVNSWMDNHPDVTTTVQDEAISWLKLNNNLRSVLMAGFDVSDGVTITDFEQGGIHGGTGENFASDYACRTGFHEIPAGIAMIRTFEEYHITVLRYNLDGSFADMVLNVNTNPTLWRPFVTDGEHKYRITITAANLSALSPADLPALPTPCFPYVLNYADNSDIAVEYSSDTLYAVGDYVYYNQKLYRCISAITTAEAWTAAHWEECVIADEISKTKFALTDISETDDLSNAMTGGGFIPTGAVGATVNPETVTSDSQMCHIVIPVKNGEALKIKGRSKTGSNRRYYCIIDENNTVVQAAGSGTADRDIVVTAEVNGLAIINLRNDYPLIVWRQSTDYHMLKSSANETNLNFNTFTDTPNMFRYAGQLDVGEFGSFSSRAYAMRTQVMEFPYDVRLMVPDGFHMITSIAGVRSSLDNYVTIPKNTPFRVAIAYVDHTLTMTESVARNNLYFTRPISTRSYEEFYSSPGIFGEFAVIGDSYSLGSMHWDDDGYHGYPQYSWAALLCKRHGCNYTLYSHGGYGISRWLDSILPTVLTDDPKDIYWWGLGINDADDARVGTNLGSIHDLDGGDYTQYPNTLYGMYGKAFEQVRNHAPLAKHVFASCIKETPNHRYTSYAAINTLLKEIADHYDVPFIDLIDDPFYTSKYYVDEAKTGHPTLIGYGGMSYANERLLNRCIVENVAYFKDYGRTDNPNDVE